MKGFLIICLLFIASSHFGQTVNILPELSGEDDFENIKSVLLSDDSLSTAFLISVKKRVPLHYHEYHSEHVVILEGDGLMELGADTLKLFPGVHLHIPAGTKHSVWVNSDKPLRAISIQTPHFDGTDRILLEN